MELLRNITSVQWLHLEEQHPRLVFHCLLSIHHDIVAPVIDRSTSLRPVRADCRTKSLDVISRSGYYKSITQIA